MRKEGSPMIRLGKKGEEKKISDVYEALLDKEEREGSYTKWVKGVYPTIEVAHTHLLLQDMYVLEREGVVCGAMILNHDQGEEYEELPWSYKGEKEDILVIHTLCVHPSYTKQGCGEELVRFAQEEAKKRGCKAIRIDTNKKNLPAQRLYTRLGFVLKGQKKALLQGLLRSELVYLEWQV